MTGLAAAAKHRNDSRYRGAGRCWATPREFFSRLDAEFNFTLDPCCTPETAKCARFFTEAEDGLAQDWSRDVVFMNPPYGRELPAWTAKAVSESGKGALVVGLLPASTDTEWFHRDVLGANAEIRYLRKRIRFEVGDKWASPFQPNIVVIWRPTGD